MDNRGSKSDFISNFNSVKEQRINGSWCIEQWLIHLRYILKYFERSTLVKNLSKQLNINRFSTLNSSVIESERRFALNSVLPAVKFNFFMMGRNSQVFLSKLNKRRSFASSAQSNDRQPSPSTLHPWFITGFTDAEGSFSVSVTKDPKFRTGWEVQLTFQIKLHLRDLASARPARLPHSLREWRSLWIFKRI